MMNDNNIEIARKLQRIGKAFCIEGPFFSYEEIKMGNVNHTYKVNYIRDDGSGMAKIKSYLVQCVNTYAFRHPIELMKNIDSVTEYIRKKCPDTLSLHFHHTAERKNYLEEADGFWRLSNYVPSVTFDTCDDVDVIRSAGEAFGEFQQMLADFEPEKLFYTIPNFHNTRSRYEQLKRDVELDPCGRVAEVREDIDFLLSREETAGCLQQMLEAGELPLRVTHNDTKLNNVLLDRNTRKSLCVLDLDTVMPGLSLYDFGDSIRFGAATAAEDEKDLSKVTMSLDLFRIYTRGFLSACPDLTDTEVEMLPMGAKLMTLECGLRFLTDYIDGDHYFAVHREGHNLDRCRTQFKLVADMESKWEQMAAIVREEDT